jgi:hypothetical protein
MPKLAASQAREGQIRPAQDPPGTDHPHHKKPHDETFHKKTAPKGRKGRPQWTPPSALGTGTACAAAQAVWGGLDPVKHA